VSIQHTVVFRLVHEPGSAAEEDFLETATATLTAIAGITEFTMNRQVSPKSDLAWQFRWSSPTRRYSSAFTGAVLSIGIQRVLGRAASQDRGQRQARSWAKVET
jgi:hypothetical protein